MESRVVVMVKKTTEPLSANTARRVSLMPLTHVPEIDVTITVSYFNLFHYYTFDTSFFLYEAGCVASIFFIFNQPMTKAVPSLGRNMRQQQRQHASAAPNQVAVCLIYFLRILD